VVVRKGRALAQSDQTTCLTSQLSVCELLDLNDVVSWEP
jgi:hypothetical protein